MQLAGAATANEIGAVFKFGALEGVITAVFARVDGDPHRPPQRLRPRLPRGHTLPLPDSRHRCARRRGRAGQNWGRIFGNSCIIDHGDGTRANYGHFRAPLAVKIGDTVALGQIIGIHGQHRLLYRRPCPHQPREVGQPMVQQGRGRWRLPPPRPCRIPRRRRPPIAPGVSSHRRWFAGVPRRSVHSGALESLNPPGATFAPDARAAGGPG